MPGVPLLEKIAASVPRGEDGYWSIILELDRAGPWTVADIDRRSNSHRGTISAYCSKLLRGGYIEPVGRREHPRQWMGQASSYRVVNHVERSPRLRKDGTELPEPLIETVWRTVKMAKRNFTAREIAALIAGDSGTVPNLNSVRSYLGALASVGIIARSDGGRSPGKAGGGTAEARYRLVTNLGGRAPKVLASKIVFDPNANAIVGIAIEGRDRP